LVLPVFDIEVLFQARPSDERGQLSAPVFVQAQLFKVQILLNSYARTCGYASAGGKLILWNRIPASRFCGRELCGDDSSE